jgi:hypothetical protein
MHQIATNFMPCSQRSRRRIIVITCQHLQDSLERDPEILLKIITGNKMWVYGYDPEIRKQPYQWNSPPKNRQDKFAQT